MSTKDIVMSAGSSATASTPAWINKLVGAATDIANAVALDASGNVYITGQTQTGTEYDSILAKYTSTGTLVWQVKLAAASNSEQGYCIAADSSSNVYIGGTGATSTGAALLVKYDTNGNVVWQQKYETTGTCSIFGIAVDSSGNVYTTGSIYANISGLGNTHSGFACKYNSSGTIQWQQILYYNVNANAVHFRGIALDSLSNVYVAGEVNNDFLTAKLNSSGVVQWKRSINIDSQDNFRGIAVDSAGNCYAVGYTNTSNFDIIFAKYNTSGVIQWVKTLSAGTTSEYGYAICSDSADNIYITGISATSTTLVSQNIVVIKYNSSGTLQWQRTLANNTGSTDAGYGICATLTNVYVAGIITQTNSDIFVASLPADGTKTGTYALGATSMVYGSASLSESTPTYTEADANISFGSYSYGFLVDNSFDAALKDITNDASGNVYIAGNIGSSGFTNVYVGKYSSTGNLIFGKNIAPTSGYFTALNIKLDSDNNIIVVARNSLYPGSLVLIKLNSDGSLQWVSHLATSSVTDYNTLAIDSSNNIYLISTNQYLFKYASGGTLQWQKNFSGLNSLSGITTDSSGNVYICGSIIVSSYHKPFFMKLNSSGTILWQKTYSGLSATTGYEARDIKVDSSGNIYLVSDISAGGFLLAKHNTTSALTWIKTSGFTSFSSAVSNITLTSTGDVWVSGSYNALSSGTSRDSYAVLFNGNTGVQKVSRVVGGVGIADSSNGATLDSFGNLVIVGNQGAKGFLFPISQVTLPQTQVIGSSSVVISNPSASGGNPTSTVANSTVVVGTNSITVTNGSGYTITDYTFPTIAFTPNFGSPTIAATSIAAGATSLTSTTVTI
jgi:uncharacterized delta-60 repeat protein